MLFMTQMLPYLARIHLSGSVFQRIKMKFFGNGNIETKVNTLIKYFIALNSNGYDRWSPNTANVFFHFEANHLLFLFLFFYLSVFEQNTWWCKGKDKSISNGKILRNLCSLSCLAIENIRNDLFLCESFFPSTRKTISFSYDDVGFARFSVYLT